MLSRVRNAPLRRKQRLKVDEVDGFTRQRQPTHLFQQFKQMQIGSVKDGTVITVPCVS